jgi:hypothetical protein
MRLLLVTGVAALAIGVYALSASDEEPVAEAPANIVKKAELPPLPEMRPTVVEPEAGNVPSEAAAEPDPRLSDAGPKPTRPASAGAHPRRVGRSDIT